MERADLCPSSRAPGLNSPAWLHRLQAQLPGLSHRLVSGLVSLLALATETSSSLGKTLPRRGWEESQRLRERSCQHPRLQRGCAGACLLPQEPRAQVGSRIEHLLVAAGPRQSPQTIAAPRRRRASSKGPRLPCEASGRQGAWRQSRGARSQELEASQSRSACPWHLNAVRAERAGRAEPLAAFHWGRSHARTSSLAGCILRCWL